MGRKESNKTKTLHTMTAKMYLQQQNSGEQRLSR